MPSQARPPIASQSASQHLSQSQSSQMSCCSWMTSASQDAQAELMPHPCEHHDGSHPGDVAGAWPGRELAATKAVSVQNPGRQPATLYCQDAAGKMENVAIRLADKGRRNRKVTELKRQGLQLRKVILTRQKRCETKVCVGRCTCQDVEQRINATFECGNDFSKGACTQLAHGFREGVGPLRRDLHVDVLGATQAANRKRRAALRQQHRTGKIPMQRSGASGGKSEHKSRHRPTLPLVARPTQRASSAPACRSELQDEEMSLQILQTGSQPQQIQSQQHWSQPADQVTASQG